MLLPFLRQILLWSILVILVTSCGMVRSLTKSKPASRTVAKKPGTRPAPAPQTFKAVRYSDEVVSDLINTARSYGGTTYRTGGGTSAGLDCSALVQVSFRQIGMKLPRTAAEQAAVGEEVSVRKARPGDLVVFSTGYNGGGYINHIGIITEVTGDEQIRFIHSSSSRGVREDDLVTEYWQKAFVKVTRVF
jgi:cell wall-associated NlpC family hydrolase